MDFLVDNVAVSSEMGVKCFYMPTVIFHMIPFLVHDNHTVMREMGSVDNKRQLII